MSFSTHILDVSKGRPATGVPVRLEEMRGGAWQPVAEDRTNTDGRLAGWPLPRAGVYRLMFDTGDYFGADAFYPEVTVTFQVADPEEPHHVPLLISPFGYSTYRGS